MSHATAGGRGSSKDLPLRTAVLITDNGLGRRSVVASSAPASSKLKRGPYLRRVN